ncbi:MAG TPA: DUF4058 family protein [Gemmataceae bacterium]|nr:DUF4058 family protein [Gemmataceae bacterium]
MAMIFPGMDPYLEDPQRWQGLHNAFIVYIRDYLQPSLRPRYIAAVEERVFVEGPDREIIPDTLVRRHRPDAGGAVALADADAPVRVKVSSLEVHENYVEILDRASGQQVVTVIELLSPTNKYQGPGRNSYLTKQREVLSSQTHLVEIDLLRYGPHVMAVPEWAARGIGPYDYLCCVNRAGGLRESYELYPRRLGERLPRMRIPLADGDPDVVLDVQAVLAQAYDRGSYSEVIDYSAPCRPALPAADQAWANERIAGARQAPPG